MAMLSEIRERRTKRRIAVWVAAWALAAAGAGYAVFRPEAPIPEEPVTTVVTRTVERTVSANARAVFREYYDLSFPFGGKIRWIAKEGEKVRKGQTVAELEAKTERFAAEKARIALEKAQAELRKARTGEASAEEIRTYETALATAVSNRETAEHSASSSLREAEKAAESVFAERERAAVAVEAAVVALENAGTAAERNAADLETEAATSFAPLSDAVADDLSAVDRLLGISDANRSANDAFEAYLAARDSSVLAHAQASYRTASAAAGDFRSGCAVTDTPVRACLKKARTLSEAASEAVSDAVSVLRATVDSSAYPKSRIDADETDFGTRLADLRARTASLASLDRTLLSAAESGTEAIRQAEKSLELAKAEREVAEKRFEAARSTVATTEEAGEDAVAAAENRVTEARTTLEWKRRTLARPDFSPLEKAVEAARKAYEEAADRVADAKIASPADGVVAKVAKPAGTDVAAGSAVLTVADTGSPYVESEIEETEASLVRTGMAARVTFDALPETVFTGSVEYVPAVSTTDAKGVVNFRVRIRLASDPFPVAEGSVGTVEIAVARAENVPVVPLRAVRKNAEGADVVRSADRNADVVVKTGISDGKTVQILDGLSVGERVRN